MKESLVEFLKGFSHTGKVMTCLMLPLVKADQLIS